MPKIITGTIVHHRNGIAGEPFYTVNFKDRETRQFLIAVVTGTKGGCHVINPEDTAECFRGDNYEKQIRDAIVENYSHQYKITVQEAKDELNDGLPEGAY